MTLSLIIVVVFGQIVSVTPVPFGFVDCIAALPAQRAAIAPHFAPDVLAHVEIGCAPAGGVVFRGGSA